MRRRLFAGCWDDGVRVWFLKGIAWIDINGAMKRVNYTVSEMKSKVVDFEDTSRRIEAI